VTLKFLTKATNGLTQLVSAITASTGNGDANKIIATNSNGLLDNTLLPPSVAKTIVDATAGEALVAGNFVYLDATGKAFKADNTSLSKAAQGFVTSAAAINTTVSVYTSGVNTALTGVTPGAVYYLGTTGALTATAPSFVVGAIHQVLGYGKSATELIFEYNEPVQFANQ
jgi:hypothetical protein